MRKVIKVKELAKRYGVHRHTMAKILLRNGTDLCDIWSVVGLIKELEDQYGCNDKSGKNGSDRGSKEVTI